jgi:hypothetical protein
VNDLLAMMIPMAVFFRIKTLEEQGGPSAEDTRKAMETADMLGERGDVLLHGGGKSGKSGECADLFNRTAHAIAVLAFAPGGVEVFGARFEATAAGGRTRKGRAL